MPRGLRASADALHAAGVRVLQAPQHFVWRAAGPAAFGTREPFISSQGGFQFEMLYANFLGALPDYGFDPDLDTEAAFGRSVLQEGRTVAEVAPKRGASDALLTIKAEGDGEVHMIVIATKVVGSAALDALVASVPWPVHAVAVGATDFWSTAQAELPGVLRAHFRPEQLILVVDAYDVMLLPCDRSPVQEYRSYGKPIVVAAEKKCWPVQSLCTPCEARYAVASDELAACREGFPNLNSGGYMGTASALATAITWMREHGLQIQDDQSTWWDYYNNFPELVALDHRQRIWSTLLGSNLTSFHVTAGGEVRSDDIGGAKVCFAHGNGNSKKHVLWPLLEEVAKVCGRPLAPSRPIEQDAGISHARVIFDNRPVFN